MVDDWLGAYTVGSILQSWRTMESAGLEDDKSNIVAGRTIDITERKAV